ncbi:putative transmembrane protein [Gordonia polyisoprenivorans VH2]|uniref:Putative transmembrane protein n=1 Tax=Gordonia polyisoprenivorans (strain DSM 44266 / VH2) TaxID=1112204 RepID=H6N1G9_GORPV|nr:hypothetical protein [Gordonia polyisoprenivorans]AFA72180.1 putative transmembrane protein [Gordonia polyisoprenivorans VH2]
MNPRGRWHGPATVAGKVGGYGASVILGGAASIISIPLIAKGAGGDGWAAIAVGQNVGLILLPLVMLGLAQNGSAEAAVLSVGERGLMYGRWTLLRSAAFTVVCPVALLVCLGISTQNHLAAVMAASSQLVTGLGGLWFYIGESQPSRLLVFDTAPRSAGILIGAVCTCYSGQLFYAGLGMLSGALLAGVLAVIDISRRYPFSITLALRQIRDFRALLRSQRHGVLTGMIASVTVYTPLVFVQWLYPFSAAQFALADRLRSQFLMAVRPLVQYLQGWAPDIDRSALERKVRHSFVASGVVAGISTIGLAALLPLAGGLLSKGTVDISAGLSIWTAIASGLNLFNVAISLACLVPIRLQHQISIGAVIGLGALVLVAIPAALLCGWMGVAIAAAASQVATAVYQTAVLFAWQTTLSRNGGTVNGYS